MAVEAVKIEADAYMVCLTHALTTEREEVMGLLIGEVFFCYYDTFLGLATFQNIIDKSPILRVYFYERIVNRRA